MARDALSGVLRRKCTGIHDTPYCKVTCISSKGASAGVSAVEQGQRPVVIVSFDLIGISAEFARKCQYRAAGSGDDFLGIAPATTDLSGTVVACTHLTRATDKRVFYRHGPRQRTIYG